MSHPNPGTLRTTVNLDDSLLEEAHRLTGVASRSDLLRDALTALIQRESARRLSLLGGSEPEIGVVPRRKG